jgi:ATP-dependent Lon protease
MTLPVLPLKNAVLFPYLLMPLSAGRPGSIAAVEAALATESKEVLVFTQRDGDVDSPLQGDLYPIGTKAVIRKMNASRRRPSGIAGARYGARGAGEAGYVRAFLKARVTPLPLPEDKSSGD